MLRPLCLRIHSQNVSQIIQDRFEVTQPLLMLDYRFAIRKIAMYLDSVANEIYSGSASKVPVHCCHEHDFICTLLKSTSPYSCRKNLMFMLCFLASNFERH